MPQRRQRLSKSQWQELIEQWQSSGLSAKQFCQEQGVSYVTFCKWRKQQIAVQSESQPEPGFIDLGALTDQGNTGWNIVLHLGDGVELRLSRH